MKKSILLIAMFFYLFNSYSQTNIFPPNGYVGIGVTSPNELLHIQNGKLLLRSTDNSNNSVHPVGLKFTTDNTGAYSQILVKRGTGSTDIGLQFRTYLTDHTIDAMTLMRDKIGISTTNPIEKLHLENGKLLLRSTDNSNNSVHPVGLKFTTDNTGAYSQILVKRGTGSTDIGLQFNTFLIDHVIETMTLTRGSVGIGTTNPGNYKLAVEGVIGAREVKVTLDSWSDFVFDNDYKLKNLEEVETYINENKKLPDIPSETEVVENGVNLGEMDAKLLQKIEELTLYMIKINKEVKILRQENAELKEEINEIKSIQ
ncbi:hypothetical protein [Ascidiimonas aurantiaca]|uniref:hypothetical protein n=1 Tax=Ascidiimonas aurantiaca TaxID=1685432 RepID=UPI0030EEBBD4